MAGIVHQEPGLTVRLRPVAEDDLAMLRRIAVEPGLIGLEWAGFGDAAAPARRFAEDGYLGERTGGLIVQVEPAPGATCGSTAGCATTRHRCDRTARQGGRSGIRDVP
ncbi:hypothetical protein [Micromonospora sp. NPDC000018]|uniref:hypothetical protein n=1 Tax=Micromonospora sp. NPDC000018 TaxID=3154239 RepID=UPI00332AC04F